jgi:hypothetical protein
MRRLLGPLKDEMGHATHIKKHALANVCKTKKDVVADDASND